MIVCTGCGHNNEDNDAFCGSCGTFLEWSGARPEQPATLIEPEPDVAATTKEPGLVERVKTRVGIESHASGSPGHPDSLDGAPEAPDGGSHAAGHVSDSAATADRARLEQERQAEQARQIEADRARAAAEAQARKDAESQRAHEQAELRAREAEAAQDRARQALEEETRAREEAHAQAERQAAARARAEAEARAREEAEERARREAEAGAQAAARQGTDAEAERQLRESAEARARAEAETRAAREAELAADARAEEEANARREAELAASTARREKEEAQALVAAQARATADAQAALAAAEAEAAKAAEAARAAEASRRAAALVVPVAVAPETVPSIAKTAPRSAGPEAVQPAATQPAAMKPAAARPRPPAPRQEPPTRTIHPGDLICGECGEGNTPERKFCRRCGTSLVTAVVAKLPWWKRFLRLFRSRKKVVKAGSRPMRADSGGGAPGSPAGAKRRFSLRSLTAKARSPLGVIIVIALLGVFVFAGPWGHSAQQKVTNAKNSVRKVLHPRYDPVRPVHADATSTLSGHSPELAIDGITTTYWAADHAGPGQVLVLEYDHPVSIDKIGFTSGASAAPEQFVAEPRPQAVHIVFNNSASSADITLKDTATFQTFGIKGRNVTRLEIHIKSVYGSIAATDTAIAEVETFFKN